MDNIKDYDDEGFELQFEDDTPEEERKYFVKNYTNVNMVADRRVHCTCCDGHIGTAPNAEKIIRMHPVLRVTQCVKCFRFYNSGEFEKGEDGSELYCRWCGQGGEVYCCTDCPYVFCKKCILRNLTRVALKECESNDNWKCFSCAPKIVYHLRAQHWALTNFIAKQKAKIDKMADKLDQDALIDAMSRDVSQCCQSRKKSLETKKRKIIHDDSDNDSEDSNWSLRKRNKKKSTTANDAISDVDSVDSDRAAKKPKPKKSTPEKTPELPVPSVAPKPKPPVQVPEKAQATPKPTPPAKKSPPKATAVTQKPPQPTNVAPPPRQSVVANAEPTEIDCSPDLFAYLVNHSYEQTHGPNDPPEDSVSSSTTVGASSSTQGRANKSNGPGTSSFAIQNVISGQAANAEFSQSPNREQLVRRVARSKGSQPSAPIYHNYNGYRIDLNNAAQQSTIRLPNGKIIHVKKQTTPNPLNQSTTFSIQSSRTQAARPGERPPPQRQQVRPQSRTQTQPLSRPQMPPRPQQIQRSSTSNVPANQPRFPQGPTSALLNQAPIPPLVSFPQQRAPAPNRYQAPAMPQYRPRPQMQRTSATAHMQLDQAQAQLQMIQRQQQQQQQHQLQQQQLQQQQQQQQQQMHPSYAAMQPGQMPNVAGGPNAQNPMLPRFYSNDQVGRARTQLERQIFNAIQICHQIDGKLKTLMNSNAYKGVEKLNDIKELYIHLSYLFTYTNGRFQSVHDKCMEDMRRLGFKNDASSLSSGNVIDKYGSDVDEDDLEIVEPRHQTISLDSDEERSPEKNRSRGNTGDQSPVAASVPDVVRLSTDAEPVEIDVDITSSTENLECDVDVSSLLQIHMNEDEEEDDANGEASVSLLCRMNDDVGIATPPDTEETAAVVNIENDLKLKSKATVSLKPVEKDYPDLMKKALEQLAAAQIEDDELMIIEPTEEDPPVLHEDNPSTEKDESSETKPTENSDQQEDSAQKENSAQLDDSSETEAEKMPQTNDDTIDISSPLGSPQHEEGDGDGDGEKEKDNDKECEDEKEHENGEANDSEKEKDNQNEEEKEQEQVKERVEPDNEIVDIANDIDDNAGENTNAKTDEKTDEETDDKTDEKTDESVIILDETNEEEQPHTVDDNQMNDEPQTHDNAHDSKDTEEIMNEDNQWIIMSEIADSEADEDCEMIENVPDIQTEVASTSKEDDNFSVNEAKSISENCSDDGEKEAPILDSHSEITSTSTAEIAMEINETLTNESTSKSDDESVAMQIANEIINEFDTVEQVVETVTDDIETDFPDLGDCSPLVNEEISNAISTSETLEVASFLQNDDFENISSPDTFT